MRFGGAYRKLLQFLFVGLNGAVVISAPSFETGRSLFLTSGVVGGFIALFIGCFVFYALSSSILSLSYDTKAGTFGIAKYYFGSFGSVICVGIMAIVFSSWFAIQHNSFISFLYRIPAINEFIRQIPFFKFLTLGMIFFFAFFKNISLVVISLIFVPTILISYLLMFTKSPDVTGITLSTNVHFFNFFDLSVLAPLLSGLSAMTLATPTLYRFTRTCQDTLNSLKIAYLLLLPFAVGCGILFGYRFPYENPLSTGLFYETKWGSLILIYATLSALSVNTMNFFFLSDTLGYIFHRKNPFVFAAALCTMFVYCDMASQFIDFFNAALGAVLTIIIFQFSRKRFYSQKNNTVCLILTMILLYPCLRGDIQITKALFFDAVIISSLMCLYFSRFSSSASFEKNFADKTDFKY